MTAFPGRRPRLVRLLLFFLPVTALGGQGVWTTSGPAADVRAIALDLENPLTVVAAGRPAGAAQDAVFTMRDSEAWTERAEASDGVTITSLVSDPSNPATIYAAGQVAGSPSSGALYVSRDSGATWSFLHLFENSPIAAFAVDPVQLTILYAGGVDCSQRCSGVLFRSADAGNTWSSSALPSATQMFALAIDPEAPNRIYAGTDGGLYFSSDSGSSWSLEYPTWVTAVAVSPFDSETVYIGYFKIIHSIFFEAGVAVTEDGGRTWVQSGVENGRVGSFAFDPKAGNVLYAGTLAGVFRTRDGGMSWSRLGDLLADSIQFDPSQGTIYAASANGVFEYEITLSPPSLVPKNRNAREVLPRR